MFFFDVDCVDSSSGRSFNQPLFGGLIIFRVGVSVGALDGLFLHSDALLELYIGQRGNFVRCQLSYTKPKVIAATTNSNNIFWSIVGIGML